eukprot:UN18059
MNYDHKNVIMVIVYDFDIYFDHYFEKIRTDLEKIMTIMLMCEFCLIYRATWLLCFRLIWRRVITLCSLNGL